MGGSLRPRLTLTQYKKETVNVTLATDDDKQLEAHNKQFMVEETMETREWLCPIQCLKNGSNNFISNIKESVDITFATDDDKQLEAHNKTMTN